MECLLYFLVIVLAILAYLLFAPFFVEIDSTNKLYRLRFHHLASGAIVLKDYRFKLDLRIAWWKKQLDLFAKSDKKKEAKKPVSAKKRRRYPTITFSTLMAIIRTFKINRFYVTMDSGNVELNGILCPVFYGAGRYTSKNISINFLGRNAAIIEIENNLAGMIWAYIYSSLKTKKNGKFR